MKSATVFVAIGLLPGCRQSLRSTGGAARRSTGEATRRRSSTLAHCYLDRSPVPMASRRNVRATSDFPRTPWPDSTVALLREGYGFIGRRCRQYGDDAFRTRLMLRDALCMTGADAAEMFYTGDRFSRQGAMPVTVLKLLQDRGSVQSLEDAAHRRRKELFLSLTTGAQVQRLCGHLVKAWRRRRPGWRLREHVVLYDEAFDILTEAACAWAGAPLAGEALQRCSEALRAMVEGAGSIGPRNWRALLLRERAERWAREQVEAARSAKTATAGSPLQQLALHQEGGAHLPEAVAA